jgi:hypothetical protein
VEPEQRVEAAGRQIVGKQTMVSLLLAHLPYLLMGLMHSARRIMRKWGTDRDSVRKLTEK